MNAILGTTGERFSIYRADLKLATEIVAEVGAREDEDARRAEILRLCRNRLSDECVEWLDAAIAISSDGSRAFAPVWARAGTKDGLTIRITSWSG